MSVLPHMLHAIYSYSAVRSLHASVRCQNLSPSCLCRLKVPVLALDQIAVIPDADALPGFNSGSIDLLQCLCRSPH